MDGIEERKHINGKRFLRSLFGLEVEKELKALLEDVKVTKIAVNPKKDRMRVYIQSIQWIQKKYIYALEKQIKKQIFCFSADTDKNH